jgi:hypothetical protein
VRCTEVGNSEVQRMGLGWAGWASTAQY